MIHAQICCQHKSRKHRKIQSCICISLIIFEAALILLVSANLENNQRQLLKFISR